MSTGAIELVVQRLDHRNVLAHAVKADGDCLPTKVSPVAQVSDVLWRRIDRAKFTFELCLFLKDGPMDIAVAGGDRVWPFAAKEPLSDARPIDRHVSGGDGELSVGSVAPQLPDLRGNSLDSGEDRRGLISDVECHDA
jgi:hypothetical protein